MYGSLAAHRELIINLEEIKAVVSLSTVKYFICYVLSNYTKHVLLLFTDF